MAKQLDFNSIKVQLEHKCYNCVSVDKEFQFHKGTIRTHERLCSLVKKSIFQFHKGTIRTGIVSKRISGLVVISIP